MMVVVGMLEDIVAIVIQSMVVQWIVAVVFRMVGVLNGIGERRRRGKDRLERDREGQQDEQETAHGANYIKLIRPASKRHKIVTRIRISRTINSSKQPERSSGEFFPALCVVVTYLITQ